MLFRYLLLGKKNQRHRDHSGPQAARSDCSLSFCNLLDFIHEFFALAISARDFIPSSVLGKMLTRL
jgi:hypothetical protein